MASSTTNDLYYLIGDILKQHLDDNPWFGQLLQAPTPASEHDTDFQMFYKQIQSTLYPIHPVFKTLCFYLRKWIYADQHPCSHVPKLDYMEETETRLSSCVESKVSELMQHKFHKPFENYLDETRNVNREHMKEHEGGESEKHLSPQSYENEDAGNKFRETLRHLLIQATNSDILKLLGFRRTLGSLDALPPDLYSLWCSFTALHHPNSKLTTSARALSKHCHRSQDNWWGVCKGSEQNKNELALDVLKRILMDIGWMNIHTLPHDVYVMEIRCRQGYGLRWSHDGSMFRGFLEPQMPDGHEKGWIH